MEVNDKSSIQLFEDRAKLHQDANSVLDAGVDAKAKHSNVLHDYFSKKYIVASAGIKQKDVVLDFGCGVGRISNFLRPNAHQIVGYDASESMLAIARKSSPKTSVFVSDLDALDAYQFDVVIVHWVLAHISDEGIINAFSKIAKNLSPNGKICIFEQTPAADEHIFVNEVYRRRTITEYENLFQQVGLKLVVDRNVYRTPSYARSIWNKMKSSSNWALPFLYLIEKNTLNFKKQHVEYYTTFMTFKK